MTALRQASFIGGEIAPGLYARTNLKRFADSLRLCRNQIPRQDGPLSNRSGFLDKGAAYTDDMTVNGRIHPFIFSSGSLARAYVLEFTPLMLRIWKNGVLLAATVVTPYTSADIPRLKFTQIGQVLYVGCLQKTTKLLTWVDDATWTLTDFTITRAIAAPVGLMFVGTPDPGDETILAKPWKWVVTARKAGTKEESLPSAYLPATCAIAPNRPAKLSWARVAGAEAYNVFRGRNGKYGFVGEVIPENLADATVFFNDDGPGPVYAETPPYGRDPFSVADSKPQIVAQHQQRMVMANMWNNPGGIEMSRSGEYKNFDRAAPPKAADAVTLNVMSDQYEEIRAIKSLKHVMLVMTNGTEWTITGSDGVVMQDDFVIEKVSQWGCSWLEPLVIGDTVVFVLDTGATVRELVLGENEGGNDLTLVAQHFFQGHSIISWAYQHEPFRVIWAVRDDGALLSCTYVKQHETWAWAQHDTGSGDKFESLCVVPEGVENVLYALVKRYVNGVWRRRFERLAPRVGITRASGVFLDAAVTVAGPKAAADGLAHLVGRTVYALHNGVAKGPYVVSGAGTIPLALVAGDVCHVGLQIIAQGSTLDVFSLQEEVRPDRKLIKKVFAEVMETASLKAGQGFDDLMKWDTTDLHEGLIEININCDWNDRGMVVWQQDEPLPVTLLSIIREVDFGGH